jgi:hypothetical protein
MYKSTTPTLPSGNAKTTLNRVQEREHARLIPQAIMYSRTTAHLNLHSFQTPLGRFIPRLIQRITTITCGSEDRCRPREFEWIRVPDLGAQS